MMPYEVVHDQDRCSASEPWAVVKKDGGDLVACHATKQKAQDQITAINISEHTRSTVPARGRLMVRAGQVHGVDFEERVISLVAVPYEQETVVQDREDRRPLREVVERSAFRGIETRDNDVTVNRDHDYGRTIGKVISYRPDDPSGLVSDVYVSDTPLGDESLRLAADGILKASVAMVVRKSDMTVRNGLRRVHRAFLDHLALVPNPAYKGARVLAVRQEPGYPAADEGQPPTPNLDAVLDSDIGEYLASLRSRR